MNIPTIFQKIFTLWKLLCIYGWAHISLKYHDQSSLFVLLDFWNRIKYEKLLHCNIPNAGKLVLDYPAQTNFKKVML